MFKGFAAQPPYILHMLSYYWEDRKTSLTNIVQMLTNYEAAAVIVVCIQRGIQYLLPDKFIDAINNHVTDEIQARGTSKILLRKVNTQTF